MFVVRKDIERNELIVGTDADMELRSEELEMQYVHFLNKPSQTSPLAPLLT
ncbi:MAG: hypothetical protein H6767_08135 [Candidatus Peribacteria bacterium]|nr:MAG: hypothetical protein H6767_08135 [Candidatus Peribacteria bacterium]